MALFSVDFYSKSLFRPVNFKLFVPNDVPPEMKMGNTYYERPTKILVLFTAIMAAIWIGHCIQTLLRFLPNTIWQSFCPQERIASIWTLKLLATSMQPSSVRN